MGLTGIHSISVALGEGREQSQRWLREGPTHENEKVLVPLLFLFAFQTYFCKAETEGAPKYVKDIQKLEPKIFIRTLCHLHKQLCWLISSPSHLTTTSMSAGDLFPKN